MPGMHLGDVANPDAAAQRQAARRRAGAGGRADAVAPLRHPAAGPAGRGRGQGRAPRAPASRAGAPSPTCSTPRAARSGATFLRNNLGKRSVALDLKHPEGRELFLALAGRFDVVCENFKAGTMDRLGLGYDGGGRAPSRGGLPVAVGLREHRGHALPVLARLRRHRRGHVGHLRVPPRAGPQPPGQPGRRAGRHQLGPVRRGRGAGRPAPPRPDRAGPARRRRHARRGHGHDRHRHQPVVDGRARPGGDRDQGHRGHVRRGRRLVRAPGGPAAALRGPGRGHRPARVERRPPLRLVRGLDRARGRGAGRHRGVGRAPHQGGGGRRARAPRGWPRDRASPRPRSSPTPTWPPGTCSWRCRAAMA